VGVEIGTIGSEHEHEENFRIHPRRAHVGCSETVDRRRESVAEGHWIISPQKHGEV
jgi:hypothetical protein